MNVSINSRSTCGSFDLPSYALSSSEKNGLAFLSVLNALLACPTFVANSLVLLVIWKKPSVRCNAIYLLGFLAASDVLVGLAAQPLFVGYTVQVLLYRMPSCFVMLAYDVVSIVLCFWSVTTSLIVTLDRCVAVLCPYKYSTILTAKRLISGVLVTWFACSLFVFMRFFGARGRVVALVRSSTFLVSIVVTTAAYVKMVRISRKHEVAIAAQGVFSETQRTQVRERKALKTAMYVVGTCLLCYLPLAVCMQVFFIVKPPRQTRFIWTHWCTTLVFIDSMLNALVYWWRIPRLRISLLELLRLRSPGPIIVKSTSCTNQDQDQDQPAQLHAVV